MSNADIAGQTHHVPGMKYVAHQPVALAHVEAVLTPGHNSRRILPPVLQYRQRIINCLTDRAFLNDSDNAAHIFLLLRW